MEPIFALDIGTRIVMGLLMIKNERGYEIIASARTEHQQRAMYDGQVHDVDEVARAVQKVKEELETKFNKPLKDVAVAAAGRALKTEISSSERTETQLIRWEREDVLALEMEAVQQALRQIGPVENEGRITYHCVGYDTISYQLEGEEIGNLIGQRGRTAKVTIIATFLPRTVVDGLVAVLGRVGLEMQSLTLEPIAAGQAAIPSNMRRHNLALVDIGAGTADIALTRDGSFFAYGMVPMAGDEVTEAICSEYLLDFQVGEKIKRELNSKESLTVTDFFGKKVKRQSQEVLSVIDKVVHSLAEKIATDVITLNQGVPQAVILIGGGSLTPMLQDKLAATIGLPPARVGIQVRERLTNVSGEKSLKGPEWITPVGIGIAAIEEKGLHYYSVSVNDVQIPIFELQLATAAEALLASGIQPRAFLGRPGLALTFELNGKMQVLKGELGQPSQLLINGQPGRLDQTLQAGDIVRFTPGIPGKDANARLKDIIHFDKEKTIYWNAKQELFKSRVFIDDKEVTLEDKINDGVKIKFLSNKDLNDLLIQKGFSMDAKSIINLRINGQDRKREVNFLIYVNGIRVSENCNITEGDRIDFKEQEIPLRELDLKGSSHNFYVNGKEVTYIPQNITIWWRGERLEQDSNLKNGMDLRVETKMPILSELLPSVEFPQDLKPGSKLVLTVNDKPAEFTTQLHPGDRIVVGWK